MKILFLHIGDLHIKNQLAVKKLEISKIVDAVNSISWDRVIFFISGDIAFSGEAKQYSVAKKMINALITQIKEKCGHTKWINTVCVPGNHDVCLSDSSRTSIELQNMRENSAYSGEVVTELKKQTAFYEFAKSYNCFKNGKVICKRKLSFDDVSIEVDLVNSALFSIKEEDKGLHYLPEEAIESLGETMHADYTIGMMHHAPDWFIDDQKNRIEKIIYDKCSIVMFGHEHFNTKKTVAFDKGREAFIQAGGCLCQNENWNDSSFHAGVLDTTTNIYEHRKFVWIHSQNQYECETIDKHNICKIAKTDNNLMFTQEFLQSLYVDEKQKLADDFRKYFVFPRLEMEESQSGIKEFLSEKAFIEEIHNKKRVMILGGYNSGKTALLKKLVLTLQGDYAVLFYRLGDFHGKTMDKVVKYRFQEIYGDSPSDYNRFQQMSSEKRIVIIDDVDQIDKNDLERFLSGWGDYFGKFIFASKQVINLDLIDRVKAQLNAVDSFFKYRLMPLYADKRNEIIKKVVELKEEGKKPSGKIVETLCEIITVQREFVNLDPDFVIKCVEYYCNNVGDIGSADSGIFGKVFEANITKALSEVQTPKLLVDKIFVILSKLAYFVHFNKAYPIQETQIIDVVEEYNQEYGATVKFSDFMHSILEAKIVIVDDQTDGYRFANKNYLAYFVARELNRKYNESGNDQDLRTVLRTACFGINADILMFVSSITENVRILRLILEMADHYTKDWDEIDFRDNLPDYLRKSKVYHVSLPGEDAREKEEQRVVNNEKEMSKSIKTLEIYDYSDEAAEEFVNRILRSLQVMIVVARCLPSFEHMMPKADKEAFVKTIFSMPNRIFGAWAESVDHELDGFVKFFKEQSKEYFSKNKEVTDDDIVAALQVTSIAMLLDLYSLPAFYATKENTIQYLNDFDYKSKDTYSLEHLLMMERESTSTAFTEEALALIDKRKGHIFSTMLTRIVGHAFVYKRELGYTQRQQLESKFFPGEGKYKKLFAQRVRNQKKEQ